MRGLNEISTMRRNITMLRIYNREYQCSSKLLVNAVVYNVDAQENTLIVRYLYQTPQLLCWMQLNLSLIAKLKMVVLIVCTLSRTLR